MRIKKRDYEAEIESAGNQKVGNDWGTEPNSGRRDGSLLLCINPHGSNDHSSPECKSWLQVESVFHIIGMAVYGPIESNAKTAMSAPTHLFPVMTTILQAVNIWTGVDIQPYLDIRGVKWG
jgi:hypothetical protein